MTRVGEAVAGRDEFQEFRYEFNDVSSSMSLDVIGGDDRVNDLRLEIVDRPELVGMEVECVYPEYLNRSPRRLPITGGMRIPAGTALSLHAKSTKPLTDVRVQRSSRNRDRLRLQRGPRDRKFVGTMASSRPTTCSRSRSPIQMASRAASRTESRSR